ncbi:MAG: ParB/RepB/Spo0J family partition protein [Chloroflexota bacterium]|nr:ParB/RepB/Spo0J family partition protein [Chloroflexota bacterium]
MSSVPRDPRVPEPAGRRKRFTVDSLFADHRPQAVGVSDLPAAKEIRLDRIQPDPDQPRRTFDEEKLAELADSIRLEGILQPIAVSYDVPRDTYVVVHGERRWRAAGLAGLEAIPAIVRDVPDERRLIQQLMENVVRDDLNAIDRAAALRALKVRLGDVAWEQVAEAVGIRRSRLFQLLGTEKLPEAAQDDIRTGRLSEKQSRALHGLDPIPQEALRTELVSGSMPAEEAMRVARELRAEEVLIADMDQAMAKIASLRGRERGSRGGESARAGKGDQALPAATAGAPGRGTDESVLDQPRAKTGSATPDGVAPAGTAMFDHGRMVNAIQDLNAGLAAFVAAGEAERAAILPALAALRAAIDRVLAPVEGAIGRESQTVVHERR